MLAKRLFLMQCHIDRLRKSGALHMWTFTRREACDYKVFRAEWNKLLTYLVRFFKRRGKQWSGVRVYEVHPGKWEEHSHGLHAHVVCNKRYDVEVVMDACRAAGWGRCHVVRVRPGSEYYVTKYLGKKREPSLKGWRLTATFGMAKRARLSDIQVTSFTATLMRLCAKEYPRASWRQKTDIVHAWWHRYVAGKFVGVLFRHWQCGLEQRKGVRFPQWKPSDRTEFRNADLRWGFMARQSPTVTAVFDANMGCWGRDVQKADLARNQIVPVNRACSRSIPAPVTVGKACARGNSPAYGVPVVPSLHPLPETEPGRGCANFPGSAGNTHAVVAGSN